MLFAVHCVDKPNASELRAATRPAHLEYLASFDIPVGGPLLDPEGNMAGSLILVEMEDRAAVDTMLASEPYNAAGLFESVSVHEFVKAVWPA